ncbi:O-antigen ligase family protein [Dyadobacter sp. LHD-138]|uniref:O-antigen ligase family protein n=1 Tax=Dyadobacter sp. LHD-138 TaxID=3071413 RepID=UPI0027E01850|nr:O-antigen ligase family protein [Dyadobacter sp. LHD-138]MDQ6481561.1 O-antigen ligase family protein [Dyadobacter sp. LHD-138]
MLTVIFLPLLIISLLFTFYKGLNKGVFLAISFAFSIPSYMPVFFIAGLPIISFNRVLSILLFLAVIAIRWKKSIRDINKFPLFFSYKLILAIVAISAFFSFGEAYFSMNVNLVLSMFFDYFIPSLLLWCFIETEKDLQTLTKYINYSMILVIAYGLITYFISYNPIVDFFKYNNPFPNSKIVFADFSDKMRGNVKGRLQAYYANAILYGGVLALHMVFSFLFLASDYTKIFRKNKTVVLITMMGCVLSLFLINSRSSLVCMFASLFVVVLLGKLKQSLQLLLTGCTLMIVIFLFFGDLLENYMPTINNIFSLGKEGNVSGSSFEMRYMQFYSAMAIFLKKPLFGWGFNYIQYLLEAGKTGDLLGAESILFQVMISGGITGLLVYIIWYYKVYSSLFTYFRKYKSYAAVIGIALFTGYLSFCILTGDLGLMKYILIYLTIIYKLNVIHHKNKRRPRPVVNVNSVQLAVN